MRRCCHTQLLKLLAVKFGARIDWQTWAIGAAITFELGRWWLIFHIGPFMVDVFTLESPCHFY